MSDLTAAPVATTCRTEAAEAPCFEVLPMRSGELAPGLAVRRALPARGRRLVGPWCFLDQMGPATLALDVAPHPHIGLQTATWLLEGELLHRDSLGSEQVIRPGQLNLMTAGRGIAHSEESLERSPLHGVQLWIALPEEARHGEPRFEHVPELPRLEAGAARATVFAGELRGAASPARLHSPAVGVELAARGAFSLPLALAFEHAAAVLSGSAELDGRPVEPGSLYYLGRGRSELAGTARGDARLLLLGGAPFGEEVLMWWNFVARRPEEIAEARADWAAERRFGPVRGYPGERLAAPPLVDRFPRRGGTG